MPMSFNTKILAKHPANRARVTRVSTAHGEFTTPAFMPVGTRAFVNFMTPDDLRAAGSEIILGGNTYHMLLSPGMEVVENAGGMHPFMQWSGPMLTDSGGFQVYSLSKNGKLCTIDETGAHFKHPVTGERIHMTPDSSIATQKIIGADIIMAFDQCTPDTTDKNLASAAMERTHRWLAKSKEAHARQRASAYGYEQALFGIIQGAHFRDLREQSVQAVVNLDFDGIALGGASIGFDMKKTVEIIDWVHPLLPENKLRYSMGVGLHPQDLIDVVKAGIDMFDCVAPTRNARHGALYCGRIVIEDNWPRFEPNAENEQGRDRINIKRSIYSKDNRPIMGECDCHTCQHFTRSYLHFLFKQNSPAFSNLACIHNVRVMHKVCEVMREVMLQS